MQKASLPKGTRDFAPSVLKKRKQIIDCITKVYGKYGFEPLETPAMEQLSTLTGKYGDEGDQLLFKILNNGDYLKGVDASFIKNSKENINQLTSKISDKGLRYDLTVPFARFVVQNRNDITFPFKRYQIQPVWRADRPQKGRYREFWQCDADVIGTKSLLCESDFIKIYHETFNALDLPSYQLKINHRKLLEAIAKTVEFKGSLTNLTVAIDKLDKIGWEGVGRELEQKDMSSTQIDHLKNLLIKLDFNQDSLLIIEKSLLDCDESKVGLSALREIMDYLGNMAEKVNVQLDLSLARGLDYYTGCIFEAIVPDSGIGSLSGGGRYDDLTGVFGLPNVSGVGISFGIDRIYDVMEKMDKFQNQNEPEASLLLCHFNQSNFKRCVTLADELRMAGFSVEVYPEVKNLRKQLDYANKRGYPYVGVIGDNELDTNSIQLKSMKDGSQVEVEQSELSKYLK